MELLPPLSDQSYQQRLKDIFVKLDQGLSIKVFGLPGCGKTAAFAYLSRHSQIQSLLGLSSNTQFLYLDIDKNSTKEVQSLFIDQIKNKITNLNLKATKLVIVLDSASFLFKCRYFQLFLSQIYNDNRPNISFVYLFSSYYSQAFLEKKLPLLKTSLFEQTYFFPFFTQNETNFAIANWQTRLNVKYSPKVIHQIYLYSGGYPSLIKSLCLKALDDDFLTIDQNSPEIKPHFQRLLSSLSKKQISQLKKIVNQEATNQTNFTQKLLIKFGLLKSDLSFFSPLFKSFLLEKFKTNFDNFGIHFSTQLTSSEYNLLNYLNQYQNQIINRDQIAQVLWGSFWQEKYSDWAIDKLLSQIRHKIINPLDKSKLITIRGRGIRFNR